MEFQAHYWMALMMEGPERPLGPLQDLRKCQDVSLDEAAGWCPGGRYQAREKEREKNEERAPFPAFRMPNGDPNALKKCSKVGSIYLPRESGILTSLTPVSFFRIHPLLLESGVETKVFSWY